FKRPNHGSLRKWCKRGVLILNSIFMVKAGENTKTNIWLPFINNIINKLEFHDVVFMLWCNRDFSSKISSMIKKSSILKSEPPYSKRFVGNGNFLQCNKILKEKNIKKIKWYEL